MKLNNKIKVAGIALLTALTFGTLGSVAMANTTIETKAYSPSTTYTNGDAATYYNGISSAATGTTLLSSLQSLNNTKRKTLVGYSAMGTSPSGAFSYTDYDPSTVQTDSKGQKYGTKILSFYSGTSTTSWNREHVWPNSHGGGSGGSVSSPYCDSDIHMPRPTISSENSNRGNSFYVEGMSHSSNGWDPVTAFGESNCYNGKSIRGECARIIFYCMVADSDLKLADSATVSSESGCTMGKLSDMLKWNLENPVNSRELNRNEGAEYLQGNRNPFIDHPEYACKIWGNTNDATKRICGNAATDTRTMTKITVTSTDSSNYYVSEGRYITLKATATYSDSSTTDITNLVTWTSSNNSYATVDGEGKVTGVAGSAGGQYVNITATYGTLSGTHGVSVWTTGEYGTLVDTGSDSGDETGVGGQIVATDLASSYESSDTLHTAASGVKFYTNNCANFGNGMQFKKSAGYLYNAEALDLKSITINNPSGGTLKVTGGLTSSSITTSITGSDNVYDLTGYKYFKVLAGSSASYCDSIVVSTNGSGSPAPTDSISLDKSSLSIDVGSTGSLVATASGNVTWNSSNSSIASVSASGTNNTNAIITGVASGNAVITATCGTKSVTCNVTVDDVSTPVTWPYKNNTGYLMYFKMSSANYYFAGDTRPNYSWYGLTTTTKDDASLVYFENHTASGEHSLYCYRNDVKTYIQVVLNGTHINFDMTETLPTGGWSYDSSKSTIVYTIDSSVYSIGSYSTYNTFSASTLDKTAYPAQFEEVVSAESYANTFLETIKCSGNGSVLFTAQDWSNMASQYSLLLTSVKNTLKTANGNPSGTTIEKCVARYDAVVAKYSSTYNDFMSRGVSNSNNALKALTDNSTYTSVIVISLVLAVTTIVFVSYKKKSENN